MGLSTLGILHGSLGFFRYSQRLVEIWGYRVQQEVLAVKSHQRGRLEKAGFADHMLKSPPSSHVSIGAWNQPLWSLWSPRDDWVNKHNEVYIHDRIPNNLNRTTLNLHNAKTRANHDYFKINWKKPITKWHVMLLWSWLKTKYLAEVNSQRWQVYEKSLGPGEREWGVGYCFMSRVCVSEAKNMGCNSEWCHSIVNKIHATESYLKQDIRYSIVYVLAQDLFLIFKGLHSKSLTRTNLWECCQHSLL